MNKPLLLAAFLSFGCSVAAQEWSLTGNAGTTPATNFLGTTDYKPIVFRMNNVRSGLIENNGTYFGFGAGENTVPTVNPLSGGEGNSAFGASALRNNTTGSQNSAFGRSALTSNVGGSENSALGYCALQFNTEGRGNSVFGMLGLAFNTTGDFNTVVGRGAAYDNDMGSYNVAIGTAALSGCKNGSRATAVGAHAMSNSRNYGTAEFTNTCVAVGYGAL
ncbi:MAG TPA: hypothetical protein VHL57_05970, partial [Flavobacteriales bacterium]|nr:hypothetical protein [Flavobacteriales bacterium]